MVGHSLLILTLMQNWGRLIVYICVLRAIRELYLKTGINKTAQVFLNRN